MKSRITYDHEAKLAYLYVLSSAAQYRIQSTDELEVSEYLELDIDQQDRIVGMEFFGPPALHLSKLAGSEKIYRKANKQYSFRISENEVKSKFHYLGIDFCFSDQDFESFIGFDVIDLVKYAEHLLDDLVR